MNWVRKEKTERIINACFLIVIGVVIAIFTRFAATTFALVSGILSLLFGAAYLVGYFASFIIHDPWLLLRGVFFLIMGSWILANPGDYLYTMVFVVCFFLFYFGIREIAYSTDLERLNIKNWWIDLINGIAMIGCGAAILVVEFAGGNSVHAVSVLCGAALALEGVMELILILALHRDFRKLNKVVSNQ